MAVDVVSGIDAVVVIEGGCFCNIPAKRITHRCSKRKAVVKEHVTQFKANQRHGLKSHHVLVIWKIMTETHIEDECLGAVEHP